MPATDLEVDGYRIDLNELYLAMWDQADRIDGLVVFRGNAPSTTSVKRLLFELFGIPVKDTIEPTNAKARRAVTAALADLGWAQKVSAANKPVSDGPQSRSGRYLLRREAGSL